MANDFPADTKAKSSPARLLALFALAAGAVVIGGCKSTPMPPHSPTPPPVSSTRSPTPAPAPQPTAPSPGSEAAGEGALPPPPTTTVGSWVEYRRRAALRIMAANPSATFAGKRQEPMASIPVFTIQVNRDGSVRNIDLLRRPKFHTETVEMAKRAIMRAAPFGPVGNLPSPMQFNEVFLYNDDLKFQLDTLQPKN